MSNTKKSKATGFRRTILEWGGIIGIIAVLYFTGLHTVVLGTMQRALLWTGLFNADTSELATTDGPILSAADYQFRMENSEGETISLQDYKGQVVFVNVWASWCPPCVAEMPTIATLHDRVEGDDNIRFILLSLDENRSDAIDFMESRDLNLPYHFPKSPIPQDLRSPYLPTTFVLSKEGKIIYKEEGIADYSSPHFSQWLREQAQE